ncbi:MAG: zf-HC2 domain-containing protein [Nitrospirota bacterium]
MNTNHSDIKSILFSYAAQELDHKKRTLVEHHLKTCADCRAELMIIRTLADQPVPDPGKAFWDQMPDKIYRLVQQQHTQKKSFTWSWFTERILLPRWILATATAGMLLIVSFLTFQAFQRESPDPLQPSFLSHGLTAVEIPYLTELDPQEISTINAWAGNEFATLAEADPLLFAMKDADIDDELEGLNPDEIEMLFATVIAWEEEG